MGVPIYTTKAGRRPVSGLFTDCGCVSLTTLPQLRYYLGDPPLRTLPSPSPPLFLVWLGSCRMAWAPKGHEFSAQNAHPNSSLLMLKGPMTSLRLPSDLTEPKVLSICPLSLSPTAARLAPGSWPAQPWKQCPQPSVHWLRASPRDSRHVGTVCPLHVLSLLR